MYGTELIMDFTGCDVTKFKHDPIMEFFRELCDKVLKVERVGTGYWESEPGDETENNPKTHGITAVQCLVTSSIVIHALDLTGELFVNVFTCGVFDTAKVRDFVTRWCRGTERKANCLDRGE